jgi:c-di-GMP-binding flagellar brake protein YcgR
MQSLHPPLGTENQSSFLVESRREMLALLRGLKEKNQLISMMINEGAEVFITSVLELDDLNNTLTIDSSPSHAANQRIIEAPRVFFEGLLDRISIQFSTSSMQRTTFEGREALKCSIPINMIRLQRRENYRINTPLSNPIRCLIPLEIESEYETIKFSLVDISCGGVALLDEKRILEIYSGQIYDDCKIDLPGVGQIDLALQIRNSQDLTLLNGKINRRVGCEFIGASTAALASVQRYIMKLERERNSKMTGQHH